MTDLPLTLSLKLSPEQLDELAERVAARLTPPAEAEWVDAEAAAVVLGYSDLARGRKRVYDLASRKQVVTTKDGKRLLVLRASLASYLERGL